MSDAITNALEQLDPENTEHWTNDGLPSIEAVSKLANDPALTRARITGAAPHFTRENRSLLPSAPDSPDEAKAAAPAVDQNGCVRVGDYDVHIGNPDPLSEFLPPGFDTEIPDGIDENARYSLAEYTYRQHHLGELLKAVTADLARLSAEQEKYYPEPRHENEVARNQKAARHYYETLAAEREARAKRRLELDGMKLPRKIKTLLDQRAPVDRPKARRKSAEA